MFAFWIIEQYFLREEDTKCHAIYLKQSLHINEKLEIFPPIQHRQKRDKHYLEI